jgi:hypothetical protein
MASAKLRSVALVAALAILGLAGFIMGLERCPLTKLPLLDR